MAHAWQNSDFGKRIDVTIPSPDGNLTAHPFPIILDGRSIVDTDIVQDEWCIYDHNDNLLDWEREAYAEAASTCTGVIWCAVDQYSSPSGEQNHVFFYYNKVSGSVPGNTASDVWDANFVGVWHMHGTNAAGCTDSTTYSNDVDSDNGSPDYQQSGAIGSGVKFDKVDDEYLEISDADTLDTTDALTISAWGNPTSSRDYDAVAGKREAAEQAGAWSFRSTDAGTIAFSLYSGSGSSQISETGVVITGDLQHHTVTYEDTGNACKIYTDGSEVKSSTTDITNALSATTHPFFIGSTGQHGPDNEHYTGVLDEVRLSQVVRSADWIAQDFAVVDTGLSYAAIEDKPAAEGAALGPWERNAWLAGYEPGAWR